MLRALQPFLHISKALQFFLCVAKGGRLWANVGGKSRQRLALSQGFGAVTDEGLSERPLIDMRLLRNEIVRYVRTE